MERLPLFIDLRGQPVLVVGGGTIAARKIRLLIDCGAKVTVLAPQLVAPLLRDLHDRQAIVHVAAHFAPDHLQDQRLVIAATGDRSVNTQVAAAARKQRCWVNVVDDAELSDAIVPSIIDRTPVLVAISSSGAAPVLARRLRERLETLLEPSLGRLASLLQAWRPRLKARWPAADERRRVIDGLLDGELPQRVADGDAEAAETILEQALRDPPNAAGKPPGHVTLVGAGPGDPSLLTLAALRALQRADAILHDRLVPKAILDLARRDAELIDVGKQGGGPSTSQESIHHQLLAQARLGRQVVRLKGGDPFVFGRGAEEWEFLAAAGIAVAVVPGITTALALGAAGIPLTQRQLTGGVRLLTAQRSAESPEPDWASWAQARDTLVIYMAAPSLPTVRRQLLQHGMSADMPVALVEQLSLPGQRVLRGRLENLEQLAADHEPGGPSILVIGHVAHWQAGEPANRSVGQAA